MMGIKQIFIARVLTVLSSAAMLILPSCVQPSTQSALPPPQRVEAPKKSTGALQIAPDLHAQTIAEATVVCESPAACPGGVGMLIAKGKQALGECTAFLIDSQTVMTNSHCLPKALRHAGADCASSVQIMFPATEGRGVERVTCERVVQASRIDEKESRDFVQKPDYAILRLASVSKRTPFKVSRAGLPNGLQLQVYSVDPTSATALKGVLRMKTCTAAQGSLLAPSFVQKNAPVGVFDNCDILAGDSGSPAIDAAGEVRAVVHATLSARAESNGSAHDNMALMTNLACASISGESASKDCAKSVSADELVHQSLANTNDQALRALAEKWTRGAPQNLEFRNAEEAPAEHMVAPALECIRSLSTSDTLKGRILFELPRFGFVAETDPAYRLKMRATRVDDFDVIVTFNGKLLQARGTAIAHARRKSRVDGKISTDPSFTLEMCQATSATQASR